MADYSGKYDRARVWRPLRNYCPGHLLDGLDSVNLSDLSDSGVKLVLLDVDNTLLPWRSEDIPQATLDWILRGKGQGLAFCIISNTRHPARLDRLAKRMDIPYFLGKKKPSPEPFLEACRKYGFRTEEAVMIGDQIFTDILGANRAGIASILLKPISGVDFIGAKMLRPVERALFLHFRGRRH